MMAMIGLDYKGWLLQTTMLHSPRALAMYAIPRAALRAIKDGTFNEEVPFRMAPPALEKDSAANVGGGGAG